VAEVSRWTKFGDFSFSRFGFIVRTDRQTDRQRRMIAVLARLYRRRLSNNIPVDALDYGVCASGVMAVSGRRSSFCIH